MGGLFYYELEEVNCILEKFVLPLQIMFKILSIGGVLKTQNNI